MNEHDFNLLTESCPRCGHWRLMSWSELNDEEQEIVKRLPDSAHYELEERKSMHHWCTRCWHEETRGGAELA